MERPVIMCVDDERGILETLSAQLYSHLGDKYEYDVRFGLFWELCLCGNSKTVVEDKCRLIVHELIGD